MADHQEPTFETIEELLIDKSINLSMLAEKGPALHRVKEELIKLSLIEIVVSEMLQFAYFNVKKVQF